jgi:hypothetical protein
LLQLNHFLLDMERNINLHHCCKSSITHCWNFHVINRTRSASSSKGSKAQWV